MPVSIDIVTIVIALMVHSAVQAVTTKFMMKSVDRLSDRFDEVLKLAIRADERDRFLRKQGGH